MELAIFLAATQTNRTSSNNMVLMCQVQFLDGFLQSSLIALRPKPRKVRMAMTPSKNATLATRHRLFFSLSFPFEGPRHSLDESTLGRMFSSLFSRGGLSLGVGKLVKSRRGHTRGLVCVFNPGTTSCLVEIMDDGLLSPLLFTGVKLTPRNLAAGLSFLNIFVGNSGRVLNLKPRFDVSILATVGLFLMFWEDETLVSSSVGLREMSTKTTVRDKEANELSFWGTSFKLADAFSILDQGHMLVTMCGASSEQSTKK